MSAPGRAKIIMRRCNEGGEAFDGEERPQQLSCCDGGTCEYAENHLRYGISWGGRGGCWSLFEAARGGGVMSGEGYLGGCESAMKC